MEPEAKSWFRRHWKRLAALGIAVLVCAAAVVVFLPGGVAPSSRLNNEEQEIDLYSGRARFTRYFLYRQVRQDLHETPLSKALAEAGGPDVGEKWVRVNIFQPGSTGSPHCMYHGALHQADRLAIVWVLNNCDPQARAKTVRQLLRVLRDSGSYWAGDDYLRLLDKTLGPDPNEGPTNKVTTANEVPDDLAERALAKRAE